MKYFKFLGRHEVPLKNNSPALQISLKKHWEQIVLVTSQAMIIHQMRCMFWRQDLYSCRLKKPK